ncbi:MAG: intradiol ring-cleavage dioxygenase [Chloroflexi bacterium]|nr:intradiol ring-cleavage dioxygenase [Chloroflexota bacterium]
MKAIRFIVLASLLSIAPASVACTDASSDPDAAGASVAGAPSSSLEPESTGSSVGSVDVTQPSCDLTPRQTEGPFYFDPGMERRDITEGKPGTPLVVELRLVEAETCVPIPGASVDIWHSDALGQYSGYTGQGVNNADTRGETFLRGTQITDFGGFVEFETVYPGEYSGRTAHIHFKARTDERDLIASQLYFPDDITETVAATEPYSALGVRTTTNANDSVLRDDPVELGLLGSVTQVGGGYAVSLTIAVNP